MATSTLALPPCLRGFRLGPTRRWTRAGQWRQLIVGPARAAGTWNDRCGPTLIVGRTPGERRRQMCRLFGLTAGTTRIRATFWLLDAPDSLEVQSHRNVDGSGIGVFHAAGAPILDKQPEPALSDEEFIHTAKQPEPPTS